jgi:DNA-binding PadR family transcriptional regulator
MSTRAKAFDLSVLQALAVKGPQHGFGLAALVAPLSGTVDLNQGMLYPALLQLEQRRWITSWWGISADDRRVKCYEVTARGRRQIQVSGAADGHNRYALPLPPAAIMLAATLLLQPSETHVRASETWIRDLIDVGISQSDTFRRLVRLLDASDVIVYIGPQTTRPALGGFLSHSVTTAGGYRYLRLSFTAHGTADRLMPVIAHELQHALEVAQAPEARDAESVEKLFDRSAMPFGCSSTTCYETRASKDVEDAVRNELKITARQSKSQRYLAASTSEGH